MISSRKTDNVDVQSGADFIYFRVRNTGHKGIRNFSGPNGDQRKKRFLEALLKPAEQLESDGNIPHFKRDPTVKKVVMIMHGIRDYGEWTDNIGRHIVAESMKGKPSHESQHPEKADYRGSSYGYFPMLGFLFQPERQKNVRWFMDEYTELLAQYPNADINFVGHSNGTYLLASALDRYRSCQFNRAVFLGSVVPRAYKWDDMINAERIKYIQNYVASKDLVVALFPGFLENFPGSDLGSAGHNGFIYDPAKKFEIRYIKGGHSAFAHPDNFIHIKQSIADFILERTNSNDVRNVLESNAVLANSRTTLAILGGKLNLLVWLLLATILLGPTLYLSVNYFAFGVDQLGSIPWQVPAIIWPLFFYYLMRKI